MLRSLPIDDPRLTFATPFPGTVLWKKYKDELLTDDFSRFTTEEPIIISEHFSPEKYCEIRKRLLRDLVRSREYQTHRKNKVQRFPYLREPYERLMAFFEREGIA